MNCDLILIIVLMVFIAVMAFGSTGCTPVAPYHIHCLNSICQYSPSPIVSNNTYQIDRILKSKHD